MDGAIIPKLHYPMELGLVFALGLAPDSNITPKPEMFEYQENYIDNGVNVMLGYALGEGRSFFSQKILESGTKKVCLKLFKNSKRLTKIELPCYFELVSKFL